MPWSVVCLLTDRLMLLLCVYQGLYRMLKAKHAVRAAIREQFEKQMDW